MASQSNDGKVFDVLVVGAGPAGIASMLALQKWHVAWIDPQFSSGRLAHLRTVPCNTKVDLLVGPGFFRHPLLQSVRQEVEPAVQQLVLGAYALPTSKDPSKLGFTYLSDCKAVYDAATAGLLARGVTAVRGRVISLAHDNCGWSATINSCDTGSSQDLRARCVVLATGVEPKRAVERSGIQLEDAFNTQTLTVKLRPKDKVAVLGNSHSAAIVLANLYGLKERLELQVANFVRRPVRLAEWLSGLDTYKYTSTGLKGFGACFGQEHMTKDSIALQICPADSFNVGDWDWVIDATGYVPSVLPEISGVSGVLKRCDASGRLGKEFGMVGLFGVGAPWPEPPGHLWGKGLEDAEGFRTEVSFIGFHMFFARSTLIASEIAQFLRASSL